MFNRYSSIMPFYKTFIVFFFWSVSIMYSDDLDSLQSIIISGTVLMSNDEPIEEAIITLRNLKDEVLEEKTNAKLYREFKVNYKKFILDLKPIKEEINIEPLMHKIKIFFKKSGLLLNWNEFEKLDVVQKINTLSMIAPITNEEKQKLLESVSLEEKIKVLMIIFLS